MSRNITYILGAGASYNALPIVSEMNIWLHDFLVQINKVYKAEFYEKYSFDIKKWLNLLSNIEQHYSIDTYAKKLHLLGDTTNLIELKGFISAFLYFHQTNNNGKSILRNDKSINSIHSNDVEALKTERIESNIDYRYDSLFAGILRKENKEIKIPNNINFISWNYDIQLELSYLNYVNSSLEEAFLNIQTIDQFSYKNIFNENINPNMSFHVKINGTALPILNDKPNLRDYTKDYLYDNKVIYHFIFDLLDSRSNYNTSLSFAWENDISDKNSVLSLARNILSRSQDIIIIGYSFPFFNREVDRFLFSRTNIGGFDRKIYLQSHPSYVERLKSDFLGIFPHLKTKTNNHIITESNLSQFVIPYDY